MNPVIPDQDPSSWYWECVLIFNSFCFGWLSTAESGPGLCSRSNRRFHQISLFDSG